MEKWVGKIAVVTGASAGIGKAIVQSLAKSGVDVIGLARRPEKIEEMVKEIGETPGKIFALKCDVTSITSIREAFQWIEENFGSFHILINNAGTIRNVKILSEDDIIDKLDEVINTNFSGLVHVTHEGFRLMTKSNEHGMIININSNGGHRTPFPINPNISHNVYYGTKVSLLKRKWICYQLVSFLSPARIDSNK
jgi:NADP+-dependent farnesol dehydrogenase